MMRKLLNNKYIIWLLIIMVIGILYFAYENVDITITFRTNLNNDSISSNNSTDPSEEAVEVHPQHQRNVTKKILMEAITSEDLDRINIILNNIKGMSYQGEILPVILDLWYLELNDYPKLPPMVIKKPHVRLEIADVLIQANINGHIEMDTKKIHDYVEGLLLSPDKELVFKAIIILSHFNDYTDVDKIVEIGKKATNLDILSAATYSLVLICDPLAEKGLQELYAFYIDDEEARNVIQKHLEKRKQNNFRIRCDS